MKFSYLLFELPEFHIIFIDSITKGLSVILQLIGFII